VLARPTADLLATVSGEPPLPALAVLGGGALGSAFHDYAVRGGSTELSAFDKDLLHSHNLARHRADLRYLHVLKEHLLPRLAETRHIDMREQSVQSDGTDLSRISLASFTALLEGKSCVIDATADPVVRRRLSRVRGLSARVARAEIFNRGRLGVCLATTLKHTQNLNCLYYQLIALADGDQRVQDWLKYESSEEFMEEELVLGFGCASKTTRMPMYKVDAHAAAAYAFIRSRATSDAPAIALHEIDAKGLSQGVSCVEPAPVQAFGTTATTGEWTVLVAAPVVAKVRELRRKAAPNETGGYLFGGIDEDAREVYVMAASAEPPGSHGTPNGLLLGRWGQTPFEKRFLRRTQRRLPPIGTWHSHPTDDAEASAKDRHTLSGFREQDARYGFPTIMGIVGGATEKFYVYDDEPPSEQAAQRSEGQSQ
jgi:proteasome lid subunit RPN8/RPN11